VINSVVERFVHIEDGRVVDENSTALPPEIAARIIWPPNASSAEDFFQAKADRDRLQDDLAAWRTFRTDVLGDTHDRHDYSDDPMTKDDMRDALDRIETARPEMPRTCELAVTSEVQTKSGQQAFPTVN